MDALGTIAYPSNCPNAAIGDVPGERDVSIKPRSPTDSSLGADVNGVCYSVSPLSSARSSTTDFLGPASTLLGASCTIPTGSTDCETLTTGFVCGTNGLADVCQFPGEGGTCVPIAQGGDLTCLSRESSPFSPRNTF